MVVRVHAELQPGAVIDSRFELLERIGSGGMGVVFRARDHTLGVTTALKVLDLAGRRGDSSAGEHVRRFRSEILLARQVRHPNVCAIYEYGEDEGLPYFTMELVEGQDLRRMLAGRGSLMGQEAYELSLEVAAGLEAIHAVGIVHRDLKPANIMRGLDGRVRLMDFGLAKAWEGSDPGLTETGSVVGSPAYMSPEQIRGERLDARSDLYSLGIVIFELFTGRLPFECDGARAAMLKHLEEEPALDDPLLPRPLEAVLGRALAKDPAERQQGVAELVREISEARRAGLVDATDSHGAELPSSSRRSAAPARPPPEAALLLPNLIRASRHSDASLRLRAVTAIGSLESIDTDGESALRRALEDPEPAVRAHASAGLARMVARQRTRGPEGSRAKAVRAPVSRAHPSEPAASPGPGGGLGSGEAPTEIRRPPPVVERHHPERPSEPGLLPGAEDERSVQATSNAKLEPSPRWSPWRVLLLAGVGLVVALLLLWWALAAEVPAIEGEPPLEVRQGADVPVPGTPPEADESGEVDRADGEAVVEEGVELTDPPPGRDAAAEIGDSRAEGPAGAPPSEGVPVESPAEQATPAETPPLGESVSPVGVLEEGPPPPSFTPEDRAEATLSPRTAPSDEPTPPALAPTPAPPALGTLVEDPDTLPRLLDAEPPEYPPVALQRRVEETVMLRILVDENGRVLEVEQLPGRSARPEFLRSATDWVRRQTYAPATRLGVRVRFWMVQPVVYELNP